MPVTYSGSGIVPAPFVQLEKRYVSDPTDKSILYTEYNITLQGAIATSGTFGMDQILDGQSYLRGLFSTNQQALVISDPVTSDSITFYPNINNITFEPGNWVQLCRYSISLTAIGDDSEISSDKVASKSETWAIEEQPNGVKNIQHTVQAVGLVTYSGDDALAHAKTWVSSKKTTVSANGVITWASGNIWTAGSGTVLSNLSASSGYWNYGFVENIDPRGNSWSISENFIYFPTTSGARAREEYTVQVNEDVNSFTQSTISVQGTIYGLGATITPEDGLRLTNAQTYYNANYGSFYTRANTYKPAGTVVNPAPTTKSLIYDTTAGAIQYTYSFRVGLGPVMSGAVEEQLNISDVGQTDVYATIPVPGRSAGPIVQYMNTVNLPKRSVNYAATFGSGVLNGSGISGSSLSILDLYHAKPNTDWIFTALKPDNGSMKFYIDDNTEEWNPIKLTYSRTMSWTIVPESASYSGMPAAIHNT